MSGTLPSTRAPARLEIISWSPTMLSRAPSLKTQRRNRGGQCWRFRYTYDGMERDTYLDMWGFLNAQRGQYETFQIVLPTGVWPRGTWGGTPLVNGVHAAGVSSIVTDGNTISITGFGKRGDFVKFGSHSKVYQLTADVNSDGSGNGTLSIMPALVAVLVDNDTITVTSVPFTVILSSDEQPLDLEPPTKGMLAFEAVEDY